MIMNYIAGLRLHSWWQDPSGRWFVIIDRYAPPTEGLPFCDPYVTLLELNSEKHITQKWDTIVELCEKGLLMERSVTYHPDDDKDQ